jgi:hypothetical protein
MQKPTYRKIMGTIVVALMVSFFAVLGVNAPAQAGAGGQITYASGNPNYWNRPSMIVNCLHSNIVYSVPRGGDSAAYCTYGVSHVYVDAGWDIVCSTSYFQPMTLKWWATGWNQWPGGNRLFCNWSANTL